MRELLARLLDWWLHGRRTKAGMWVVTVVSDIVVALVVAVVFWMVVHA
jgi:hypothetical protein